jgi:hypothetical protein
MLRRLGRCLIVATVMGIAGETTGGVMKGWELYSWRDGGEWRFALHLGTNRTKSCDEIKDSRAVKTVPELDAAIVELARTPGDEIIWEAPDAAVLRGPCDLAYPPPEIAVRIRERIRQLGLGELR